ncbi:uncharacterized protein BO97DRAFT_420140 [Aspergillus homomorphus CBS 101889]|uniref:Uncharacterized protein n=1 Tax=Aspergillus homomorphus (strain CBS 101889) TaxID=1450537 RepID=A0A395I9A6_ASPHC|nr:hypothetical protein BO97DRAFT_420140 [Aspergillus homomorphus CBS 101889]RAL16747.1 hypothetical protein BO97DRAFT_420140 [Aspergillus homomorphus CBS 101889]
MSNTPLQTRTFTPSNYKTTIIVCLLILVPIVTICCIFALAVACSEYCSSRGKSRSFRGNGSNSSSNSNTEGRGNGRIWRISRALMPHNHRLKKTKARSKKQKQSDPDDVDMEQACPGH